MNNRCDDKTDSHSPFIQQLMIVGQVSFYQLYHNYANYLKIIRDCLSFLKVTGCKILIKNKKM